MPLRINGSLYYRATEVLEALGISRQTLWRWRQDRSVPQGALLRGKLVFSAEEVEQIRDFAFRLEPAEPGDPQQLALFNGGRR